ncbi:MAG: DNA polymerase I [Lachnospiraceae bacterium]|nr:DNA polymerase I [Lachnospiraceae bacterium]
MTEKIVLIDGHSILNRAFYGVPDLTNAKGQHTNAVYGFLNILFKILEEEKPQYLTVAFDVSAPTFRHQMYEPYKGTRKPMLPELKEQVPLMKEMLTKMGVTIIEQAGLEADDILGTLSRIGEAQGMDVSIVSGDRDLLQLATKKVQIRIPKTKKTGTEIENYFEDDVKEKYHVTPTEFIDVKALMGDSSDNIPGVPGIGEKGATKLIEEYHSIEEAFSHLEEIRQTRVREALRENYELAKLCKTLATIKVDCELDYDITQAKLGNLYTKEAYLFCRELEFKNILSRFSAEETVQQELCIQMIADTDQYQAYRDTMSNGIDGQTIAFELLLDQGEVLGLAIASSVEEMRFIPAYVLSAEKLQNDLRTWIEQSNARFVTMDLKAQIKRLFTEGMQPELRTKLDDLSIVEYLLNPLKKEYLYEDLAKDYAGQMYPSQAELIGKLSYAQAYEKQPEQFQSLLSYRLATMLLSVEPMMDELKSQGMYQLYETIERPLIFVLADMELAGIRADGDALKVYGEQLQERILELETEIYREAGEEFNINSPKQLGVILFEKLQMPYGKKTKTGYSTAAEVLEKLAPEYPLVDKILEYRQLTKLKSTYADGLGKDIDADGRIRSTFNQTITATGRISSTEPNLQNIPIRMELGRLIRKVFLPKEGYVFLDSDYSQIELRVLAHMSGDERLIDAYNQAQDIHAITASQVFHVPFDEVTPLLRRNAKAVNFGIVYGISSFGLSQDLSITRQEAAEYIKQYFLTYPGIKEFLDGLVEAAKKDGYVTTLYGRRRPVPELSSSNFMQRSFGERVAMNSPIQGTAADIIKIAMIRVHDRLREQGLSSCLILQVHDELLIETKKEELDQVKQILEEEMHHAADLAVDLEVDTHEGETWYDAK